MTIKQLYDGQMAVNTGYASMGTVVDICYDSLIIISLILYLIIIFHIAFLIMSTGIQAAGMQAAIEAVHNCSLYGLLFELITSLFYTGPRYYYYSDTVGRITQSKGGMRTTFKSCFFLCYNYQLLLSFGSTINTVTNGAQRGHALDIQTYNGWEYIHTVSHVKLCLYVTPYTFIRSYIK